MENKEQNKYNIEKSSSYDNLSSDHFKLTKYTIFAFDGHDVSIFTDSKSIVNNLNMSKFQKHAEMIANKRELNIKRIQYNWTIIIICKNGYFHTSVCILIGRSQINSDVFPLPKASDTVVEPYNATLSVHQNSLLVWTSRENDDWKPYLSEFILLFQLL